MRKVGAALILASLLLVVGLSFAIAQEIEPSPPFDLNNVTVPTQPPMALLGEGLYAENCAPCHGAEGNGDGEATAQMPVVPTAFSDPTAVWELSPAEFFHTTKFGRIEQMMPPWQERMTDDQTWQAVYYAWDLHTSEAEMADGAALYAADCASCHGEQGLGDGPDAETQLASFADIEAMMSLSQADLAQGWADAHADLGADWDDAQKQSVLSYIRAFTYSPSWVSPVGSGPGMIQGTVEQFTPDGAPFEGGTVSLEVYAHMTPLDTIEATANADGTFEFDGLPVDPGIFYLITTEHEGISYASDVLRFGQDTTLEGDAANTLEAVVPIYDTSSDGSGVNITRMSWIVEHEPGALLIGQVVSFGNNSDTTFVGSEVAGADTPVTLEMPLPEGAEEIGLQDGAIGGVYRQVGNRIYDTRPVPPGDGMRQIFVRYRLPFDGDAITIQQPLDYNMSGLNLLVADLPELEVDAQASNGDLTFAGVQDIQGLSYLQWTAAAMQPQDFTLTFSGLIRSRRRSSVGRHARRCIGPGRGQHRSRHRSHDCADDGRCPLVGDCRYRGVALAQRRRTADTSRSRRARVTGEAPPPVDPADRAVGRSAGAG
ncbi:MAG: c-type cytochrome [Caldilineaceae bacterium]